jgi:hypothetical protein
VIAANASARRNTALRRRRKLRNGSEAGRSPIFARPAAKKSPDISPWLSAFSTTALPSSRATSTAARPTILKPETKITS